MGRWLTVRVVAWVLRRNQRSIDKTGHPFMTIEEIDRIMQRTRKHRDSEWRQDVILSALARTSGVNA
jgi:hypothetical protein